MATQSARTTPADKPAPPTITVAKIINDDGTPAEHIIRPIHHYELMELLGDDEPGTNKSSITLSWLAAGKPGDDAMAWFATLLKWDMEERPIPPTNGARRKG